jgi:formylglycine-generating enzyme required for sulfatase activity
MRYSTMALCLLLATGMISCLRPKSDAEDMQEAGTEDEFDAREPQPPPVVGVQSPNAAIWLNKADGMRYVWIEPGTFMLGCSPGDSECTDDEKPARSVTIPEGFWMGQTPVTQWSFEWVTRSNLSHHRPGNRPFLPVERVTWDEAASYCKQIGGRLPTEEEWEYAARGGSAGARYGELNAIAWYKGNSGGFTHEVGQKLPNGFGLYDMLGNVMVWTADWCNDSRLLTGSGLLHNRMRSVRGASAFEGADDVRVSDRTLDPPGRRFYGIGFRCVASFPDVPHSVLPAEPARRIPPHS